MDFCIRSRLTSGLVVVGVSALIVAPVASPRFPRSPHHLSRARHRLYRLWQNRPPPREL
jgi:hypothetical protein